MPQSVARPIIVYLTPEQSAQLARRGIVTDDQVRRELLKGAGTLESIREEVTGGWTLALIKLTRRGKIAKAKTIEVNV